MKYHKRHKHFFLFFIVTAMLMILPQVLWAQETKIDSMKISVMAEYDDPRVLAIFEPVLSQDTQLPLTAQFNIPQSAEQPQIGMACEVPEGQGHRCKIYNTKDNGKITELTYKVEQSRNLFLEYYWDPFKGKTGDKSFTFDYVPAYDVGHLEIQVVEPKTSSDFKLTPESNNVGTSNEGLKTHSYTFDNLKKDQPVTINASYVKNDNSPSVTKQTGAAANQGQESQAPGASRSRISTILALILLIIGGGIGLGYWRVKTVGNAPINNRTMPKPKAAPGKGAKKAKSSTKNASAFCSNCGSKVESGAKFCSKCGHDIIS